MAGGRQPIDIRREVDISSVEGETCPLKEGLFSASASTYIVISKSFHQRAIHKYTAEKKIPISFKSS